VVVERRAEAVQKRDAAEPRAGSTRRVGSSGDTGGRDQSPLDLIKKDLREGVDSCGPVGKHAAQALGDGDHPLPHRHRWNHVIDKMRGRLGHVAAVAGRADAAALAGEGHDEPLAAARAAEQRALAAKRVRVLSDIADAQAAAARAGAQTATTERQQKAADADQSQAENRLEQAKLEREQLIQSAIVLEKKGEETNTVKTTGRAPRERETNKQEFGAVLKYGRMYLMHVYKSGKHEVNTEEFVITTGLLHNTADPKPSAGLDLRASDSLQSKIRQRLNVYPPGTWYMCLVVHPDSFEEFLSLKAAIVSLGYEYRLMPTNKGVMDRGGSGGNVQ